MQSQTVYVPRSSPSSLFREIGGATAESVITTTLALGEGGNRVRFAAAGIQGSCLSRRPLANPAVLQPAAPPYAAEQRLPDNSWRRRWSGYSASRERSTRAARLPAIAN